MTVLAWIATVLLVMVLLPAGVMKLTQPPTALVDKGLKWVVDMPLPLVRAIGALEVLAVVGLVGGPLVGLSGVAIAAAVGVVLLMTGALVVHARRAEGLLMGMNVVVAVLVILGRLA